MFGKTRYNEAKEPVMKVTEDTPEVETPVEVAPKSKESDGSKDSITHPDGRKKYMTEANGASVAR